jgi:hypothetical protein
MGFFMMGKNDIIRIYGLLLWILLNESIYVEKHIRLLLWILLNESIYVEKHIKKCNCF